MFNSSSIAYKGHNHNLYQRWIRESIGHLFENWLGVFFGNVPWNFTTSHIFIHHRLDGGCGDTFYEWWVLISASKTSGQKTFLLRFLWDLFHLFCQQSTTDWNANKKFGSGTWTATALVTSCFTLIASSSTWRDTLLSSSSGPMATRPRQTCFKEVCKLLPLPHILLVRVSN